MGGGEREREREVGRGEGVIWKDDLAPNRGRRLGYTGWGGGWGVIMVGVIMKRSGDRR